jgi:hypothetical protein
MVGNFVYELQPFLDQIDFFPLTQHPTLSKASHLLISHTRDPLQNNPRLAPIVKVPKFLIMPTILVGFSPGAATNPPTMWSGSVPLPSIAK